MRTELFDGRLVVKVGDITAEDADAIVNAANSALLGGGGVDGAIHQTGGPSILAECRKIRQTRFPNGLPTGSAVITTAGDLPARFVIHTVGPIYGQNSGDDARLLADSYRNSMELAMLKGLDSIAFPSISTGAFGYPKAEAARVVSQALANEFGKASFDLAVRLVFFAERDADTFIGSAIW